MTKSKWDIASLKLEINEVSRRLKAKLGDTTPEEATVLCSIRAHMRGKLHMTKVAASTASALKRYPTMEEIDLWNNADGNGIAGVSQVVFWTMEDQEKLVGDIMDEYLNDTEPVIEEIEEEEGETVSIQLVA